MRARIFMMGSISALILLGFLTSCARQQEQEDLAVQKCIELCLKAKEQGINLSNGPCLSDFMDYDVYDYVCDVAHWPRENIDNKPENQCIAYRQGLRHHFIEVDPDCNFIRKH